MLSGDVFIYIGDLRGVIEQTARVLRPGGLFAFSLESQEEEGYRLRASRRYTHSIEYARKVADQSGLEEVSATQAAIRSDAGRDVVGWLIVLRKPAER